MNRSLIKVLSRKEWIHVITWTCIFLGLCFSVAFPQTVGRNSVELDFKDYYRKNVEKRVAQTVYQVDRNHLKPALRYYSEGRVKRTLPDLKFVLRYVPNHPKALQLMGVVAIEIGRPKLGSTFFRQAVHLFPAHALTFAQYGKYLIDIGDLEEAVKMLDIAIKKEPRFALAYAWLELAYTKKGDVKKSKEIARKAKGLNNKND